MQTGPAAAHQIPVMANVEYVPAIYVTRSPHRNVSTRSATSLRRGQLCACVAESFIRRLRREEGTISYAGSSFYLAYGVCVCVCVMFGGGWVGGVFLT